MVYAVTAQVVFERDGWRTSKQIPTFYLDSAIQGIVDLEHAEAIAKSLLEHTPQFTAHVLVNPVPDAVITRGLY